MTTPNDSNDATSAHSAANAGQNQQRSEQKVVMMTRIIDAPRELVFKAWTDPQHVAQWWGPEGFTNPVCELDVRPGGAIRIDMTGPDGTVYPNKGVYLEIVEPERLVFRTGAFEDAEGNPELEDITTVTFTEHEGKTKLTMRAVVLKASAAVADSLDGMEEGWSQTLDRLVRHLSQS